MMEYNQIETITGNDSKLSKYSSKNLKKSLDFISKTSNQKSTLETKSQENSPITTDSDEFSLKIERQLFSNRVIFLDGRIEKDLCNTIYASLVCLEAIDPEKDIYLYINSTGGSVSAGTLILDTMKRIRPDVCTICTGVALGLGALILSGGTRGKRMSLPSSQVMIGQPFSRNKQEQIIDDVQVLEMRYIKNMVASSLAENTGQTLERIYEDTDQPLYMSPIEAKEYGLIDTVIDSKRFQLTDMAKKQIQKIHNILTS